VAVTTDIIVGFPGETAADFDASLDFVQRMQFAGGHVFTYSERPGTPAASFPGSIPHTERKARNARMQSVLLEAEQTYRQSFVGQELAVLWESALPQAASGWELSGLTDNYLRVRATSETHLWNRITPVKLTHINQHDLVGQVLC
jgi:threonylcarbamoyladenosine tRNA methylthiotransferase MtaB